MSRKPSTGIHVENFHHGTHTGYANHGCRCTPCRDAGREWRRDWYARNREKRTTQVAVQQKRFREQQALLPAPQMTGKRWTPEEDGIVLRRDIRIADIAAALDRSHKSVSRRREVLRAAGREWSVTA